MSLNEIEDMTKRHGLEVYFGDYEYDEVIRDVQLTVGNGKILVNPRTTKVEHIPRTTKGDSENHLCVFIIISERGTLPT